MRVVAISIEGELQDASAGKVELVAQRDNVEGASDVITDAQAGRLPSFAIVDPTWADSQHNDTSMADGDNWIGRVLGAILNGPDWN